MRFTHLSNRNMHSRVQYFKPLQASLTAYVFESECDLRDPKWSSEAAEATVISPADNPDGAGFYRVVQQNLQLEIEVYKMLFNRYLLRQLSTAY